MEGKEKFLRVYANLPLALRKEIVLVFEEDGVSRPLTWDAIYVEVVNGTSYAADWLKKLVALGFI